MKLCVLISGPYRYLDKVLEQVNSLLLGSEYDIFIHIWKSDSSVKERGSKDYCLDSIRGLSNVIEVIEEKQKNEEEVLDDIKSIIPDFCIDRTIGHSSMTAMTGMFYAINKLYNSVANIDEYDYVLRMRTDISFHTPSIIPKEKDQISKVVYVSKNPLIDKLKISDHTMLASPELFKKIWCYESYSDFIIQYNQCYFNPEILLKYRFGEFNIEPRVVWKRFIDYNVVYSEHHPNEPDFFHKYDDYEMFHLQVEGEIRNTLQKKFEYTERYRDNKGLRVKLIKSLRKNFLVSKAMDKVKAMRR
jgi:hypothetical protein